MFPVKNALHTEIKESIEWCVAQPDDLTKTNTYSRFEGRSMEVKKLLECFDF